MKTRGEIYKEEGVIIHSDLRLKLLNAANEVGDCLKASTPIKRGNVRIGFGINKIDKDIAVDNLISIARAIKSLKGW